MKAIKYSLCAVSLAITLSFISAAIITSKEFPVSERILFLMTLFGGLVLLGGFFVLIAERKQLVQNQLKIWLYVIFIPVVSWLDILFQPEPDGSNRLGHFSKDVYKFAMYLWGYKSRAIFFVLTIGALTFPYANSSEFDYKTRLIVSLIYALLDISVGFYFFKIAERKQCFIFKSKILTALYLFFVPAASWKEIFLKPEADGTRVKAILNDTTSIARFFFLLLLQNTF